MINLKLKLPNKQIVHKFQENLTFSQFLHELSQLTQIPQEQIIIKIGFPPKPIIINQINQNDSFQIQLDIENGDSIIIDQDKSVIQQKQEQKQQYQQDQTEQLQQNKDNNTNNIQNNLEQIPDQDGMVMIRRIIESDNSCLFNSIAYAVKSKNNSNQIPATILRQIVSNTIAQNKILYTDDVLEKPNNEYCQWILKDQSWGGYIECGILSEYFKIQIYTINIQNLEHQIYGIEFPERIYLLYDGIHYDVFARNIYEDMEKDTDITIFDKNDQIAENGVRFIANELKKQKKFTDTSKFSLQCGICLEGFIGQEQALEHGKKTGHMNFQEVQK